MKKLNRQILFWSLRFFFISLIIFTLKMITVYAQDEETASSIMGRENVDYKMVYTFPLMHRDVAKLPLELITIANPCKDIKDIGTACIGGFTTITSEDNTNGDHLLNTQEVIHLTFKKGKVPTIKMEEALHEIGHACFAHSLSRSECKSNWRYLECTEKNSYCIQSLYNQVLQLQKLRLIKII